MSSTREANITVLTDAAAKRYAKTSTSLCLTSLSALESEDTLSHLGVASRCALRDAITLGPDFKITSDNLDQVLNLNCLTLTLWGEVQSGCVLKLLCVSNKNFRKLIIKYSAAYSVIKHLRSTEIKAEEVDAVFENNNMRDYLGTGYDFMKKGGLEIECYNIGSCGRGVDLSLLKLPFVRKIVAKTATNMGLYIHTSSGFHDSSSDEMTPCSATISLESAFISSFVVAEDTMEEKERKLSAAIKFIVDMFQLDPELSIDAYICERLEMANEAGIYINVTIEIDDSIRVVNDHGTLVTRETVIFDQKRGVDVDKEYGKPINELIDNCKADNLLILKAADQLKNALNEMLADFRANKLINKSRLTSAYLSCHGQHHLGKDVINKMIDVCDFSLTINKGERVANNPSDLADKLSDPSVAGLSKASVNLSNLHKFRGHSLDISGVDPSSIDEKGMALIVARVRGNAYLRDKEGMSLDGGNAPSIQLSFAEMSDIKTPIIKMTVESVASITLKDDAEVETRQHPPMIVINNTATDNEVFDVAVNYCRATGEEIWGRYEPRPYIRKDKDSDDVSVRLELSANTKILNSDSRLVYAITKNINNNMVDTAKEDDSGTGCHTGLPAVRIKMKAVSQIYGLSKFDTFGVSGEYESLESRLTLGNDGRGLPVVKVYNYPDDVLDAPMVKGRKVVNKGNYKMIVLINGHDSGSREHDKFYSTAGA